ncbi:MMPL family transporter [Heyndrickxia sp. FSL K6-6286]|uniref:MMPL family transporter n=1 Tax=Heyndrickxia sp. FSL K6-6286 TaxID=2921510 RepID=UPI003159DAF1
MKLIVRFRWIVLALWIVAAAVLAFTAPGMEQLVREKGQIAVPDGYPSTLADDIMKKHSNGNTHSEDFIIVFHSKSKLNTEQTINIEKTINHLKNDKEKLGINEITSHFDQKDLKNQLVSKDGKTVLTILSVDMENKEVQDVRDKLNQAIKTPDVETMMTGDGLINEDVIISSQNGLKKTEIITVVFILLVLILVFRSVVAPIIPLVTVGMTYLVSQSVVAFLVDKLNFPLSNFTQIFLVAVLFGIGTDYCILLLSRYKEELSNGNDTLSAILATYKSAGKTVIYSGLAVMIGFASIGFASFKLYQSASAVAIGVIFLLISLLTIVPFFMATLKKKLFWPIKGNISHSQSKLWGWMGNLSITRPLIALCIVAIFTVPLIISYDGDLSFNSLDEIGEEYESVRAFNLVADSFGPGEMMPIKVVIENDESVKSKEYLAIIEKLSNELSQTIHVEKVRSATRPVGDLMEDLYVKNQVNTLSDGLNEGNNGIGTIKEGLSEAAKSLSESTPKLKEATDGIGDLQSGTLKLQSGLGGLQDALSQIESNMRKTGAGTNEIKAGIIEAKKQAIQLKNAANELLTNYQKMQKGIAILSQNYNNQIYPGLESISNELTNLNNNFIALENKYSELLSDNDYLKIKLTIQGSSSQLESQLLPGIKTLNVNLTNTSTGLSQANMGLNGIITGLSKFASGFDPIITGLDQIEIGITKLASGQNQVIQELPEFSNGLKQIADGQKQLQNGFSPLDGQMSQLSNGLNQSAEGLGKIESGINDANSFLSKMSQETTIQNSGIYIPDELMENKEYQQVFDTYLSEDGKVTTIDLVLNENPYSNKAMRSVDDIENTIHSTLKGTKLENAHIGIAGITSMNHDLENMSNSDYNRTVMFMISGITIILIILLRSLIMPIYLIASLLLTYYSSVSITEFVFVNILGHSGISWAVPFFGFVIIMALGVDYSIFLMDRFSEYRHLDIKEGLLIAMKNMGTVIISAAIILAGTFAAMLPSGVMSLLQIATIVLSGLLFYAFIILPLFVPVMVRTLGKGNWWPFISNK